MLTPIDIQNHQLKSRMGFYDKKDTDDFIESVQSNYEQLYKENHNLKEQMTALSDGIQYYKQMEGTLQQTLAMAEKAAAETLEKSKTAASRVETESRAKADIMLGKAKKEADALVEEAKQKAEMLTKESEEKAQTLTRESEEKAQRLTRESEEKARRLEEESKQEAERLRESSKAEAEKRIAGSRSEAEKLIADARYKSETLLSESKSKATKLLSESKTRAEILLSESKKTADHTINKAKTVVETAVSEAQGKAQKITTDAKVKADRIMTTTKADAHDIVKETKESADEIMVETNLTIKELSTIVKKLMKNYEEYKKRYKELLKKQIQQLDDEYSNMNVQEIESLLESRHVILAESQSRTTRKINDMSDHADELEITEEDIKEETSISAVDDLLAELGAFDTLAAEDTEIDSLDINSFIEKTMAESIAPPVNLDEEIALEPSVTIPSEPLAAPAAEKEPEGLVNIDTSMFGSTASGISVDPEEAEVSYNKPEETVSEEEKPEEPEEAVAESNAADDKAEDEGERLFKPAKPMTFKEDPFAASMLGTSFDDVEMDSFDINADKAEEEAQAEAAATAEPTVEEETAPEKPDEMPSFQPEEAQAETVPDFAALAAEALKAEAEAMKAGGGSTDFGSGEPEMAGSSYTPEQPFSVPMPDFGSAADAPSEPVFQSMSGKVGTYGNPAEESSFSNSGMSGAFGGSESPFQNGAEYNASMDAGYQTYGAERNPSAYSDMSAENGTYESPTTEPAFTNMSGTSFGMGGADFSTATQEDMSYQQGAGAFQYSAPVEDTAAAGEFSDHTPTIQETYDPQNYLTEETYFGSADNVPYSGNAAADFNNGITGEEETPQVPEENAQPVDLFSTPSDISVAPANDEFAVSGNPSGKDAGNGTPFTFIDADGEN